MKQTLKDLLSLTTWSEVKEAMLGLYPDEDEDLDKYEEIFLTLVLSQPEENTEQMSVRVKYCKEPCECCGAEDYWEVFGIKPNDSDTYALEFASYESWLGFYADQESLNNMTIAEFIAHCMYEITFFSFDEKAKKKFIEELAQQVEDIESGKIQGKPWEEVKAELEKIIREKLDDDGLDS